jgi:predicted AAA+ superfamily ATPase
MAKSKYSEPERAFVRELLKTASPRDRLPYTAEFKQLKSQFVTQFLKAISDIEFWALLSREAKKGGLGKGQARRRKSENIALTNDEQLEVLRLFPDGIGGRDRLPYTTQFDELHRRFRWLTQRDLSKHQFWLAMTNVAKKSHKPKPVAREICSGSLPDELVQMLLEQNSWWIDKPWKKTEPYRRWAYREIVRKLDAGIAPIIAVRGTRQVGKSELQHQFVEELLLQRRISPSQILRVQFDELPALGRLESPILEIVRWFEDNVIGDTINAKAAQNQTTYLLFDELQNLKGWENQLKSLVDHRSVKVIATGSSALRIAKGQDSLAGRVNLIHLGTLRLREIAMIRFHESLPPATTENGIERWAQPEHWRHVLEFAQKHDKLLRKSFQAFSSFGGYPICHRLGDETEIDRADFTVQIKNMVIERTIQHDLTAGPGGRLRQAETVTHVFRQLCRFAGQAISTKTISKEFSKLEIDGISNNAIEDAISFLRDSLLVFPVPPFEGLGKKAAHPPKYCLADHFIREAWLQEQLPLHADGLAAAPEAVITQVGHLAESVAGTYLSTVPGVELSWLPPTSSDPEVDFVITIGLKRIPVEVKYQRQVNDSDAAHVRHFIKQPKYNAPFGIVITQERYGEHNGIFYIPLFALMGIR